jgi:hypothetical protein
MSKQGSRLRRRPSASMIVSCVALFVALSGGAYAAVIVPNDSVGSNQLKSSAVRFRNLATGSVGTRDLANNSVSYTKIAPGEIGHARVSQGQIQWRVTGKCTGATAIQSVSDTGAVTCVTSLPTDYTTAGISNPLTSATSGTALAGESLPAGTSYLVTATPYIQVNNGTTGSDNVVVSCEIDAGSVSETRSVSFALGTNHEQESNAIPLSIAVPAPTSATEVAVGCVRGYDASTAPTVQASSGIDALATATDDTTTTPGTSTTAFSITVPTTTTTAATTTTTASTTTAASTSAG